MSAKSGGSWESLAILGLLLAILLLGMGLRLHDLDADSLWYDEIHTAVRAESEPLSLVARIASGEGGGVQLPLIYVVSHFFVRLLGDSEFILRFQAMLFGSLTILLAYKVGEILYTSKQGLLGAFLLAVNPYHVQYSQEARHYALMVFLALLSLILLLKALERNRKRLWIGFVLCTSLSLYNAYFAFLLLPAEIILAAWVIVEEWRSFSRADRQPFERQPSPEGSPPGRKALALFVSLALVGLSLLPWVPTMQAELPRQVGSQALGVSTTGFQLSLSLLYEVFTTYSGAEGAPLLLWLALVVLGLAACEPKHIVMLLLWIGVPFVFLALVGPTHFVDPRYLLFILPLYLLVVAGGITHMAALLGRALRGAKDDRMQVSGLIVALIALGFGVLSLVPLGDYYLSQKEDWRGAAHYLDGSIAQGDVILVDAEDYMGDARWVDFCLSYYLSSHGIAVPPVFRVGRQLWQDLQSRGQDEGNVWLVLRYPNRPRSWNRVEQITVVDFQDVPVIRLREPSGGVLQDTVSILEMLPDLFPTDTADFDVRVALAEIYLRTNRFDQARLQLDIASEAIPDKPMASRDLADTFAELGRLARSAGNLQVEHSLLRNLGQVISFVGYSVHPRSVAAGESVQLTLWWRTLRSMDRDYTAFIHMVGPDDRIWAQSDRLLRQVPHGGYPTSSWRVSERVSDDYELQVTADTPPGKYLVKVGIYYWGTGERLPVFDENGQRISDDTISLEPIVVTQ